MYRAHLTSDFFLADYKVPLGTVIMEDVTASHCLVLRCGTVEPYVHEPHPIKPSRGSTVLIIRPGGIGDLLFLTPIIAALAELECKVTVSTHPRFQPILHGQPCELLPYPLLESVVDSFEEVIFLENVVEDSPQEHVVDLFAKEALVELTDKKCRYVVTPEEDAWAAERFPHGPKPRIGVQTAATASCRTYPEALMGEVMGRLHQAGCDIFVFGAPGSVQAHPMCPFTVLPSMQLGIRQSAAVLSHCDAVVAPDSMITHLAGALQVPCVALYAPFAWETRTKYHPTTKALSGKLPCAPCFHHARAEPWPLGKPCATTKRCEALAQIAPETVVKKVMSMIQR